MTIPKIKNKKELKKELLQWKREKSLMPYPKEDPLPVTKASEFEQLIYKHCRLLAAKYQVSISCAIIDVNGIYINGKWYKTNSTKGVADVHITLNGKAKWVEVKFKKDYQKPDQKKFQGREELAGATYDIVKTPDDWFSLINSWL